VKSQTGDARRIAHNSSVRGSGGQAKTIARQEQKKREAAEKITKSRTRKTHPGANSFLFGMGA